MTFPLQRNPFINACSVHTYFEILRIMEIVPFGHRPFPQATQIPSLEAGQMVVL